MSETARNREGNKMNRTIIAVSAAFAILVATIPVAAQSVPKITRLLMLPLSDGIRPIAGTTRAL